MPLDLLTPQKKLSGHPNVVQFCSAASISKEESDTGQAEFLILTELCKGKESSGACMHAIRAAVCAGLNAHRFCFLLYVWV